MEAAAAGIGHCPS
jgi:hypothetical protein